MGQASHFAALGRWDTGVRIADESYVRLRENPHYPLAVRTFAVNMLAAGDADPVLDGILKDAGRNVAAMCTAHLHFSGGLTLPRLKALCARSGLVSPGRARALLLYLRYLGYVEPSSVRRRGEPMLYLPTASFLATWREHLRAVLGAVQHLEPAVGILLDRFDTPGIFETYAGILCEVFIDAARSFDVESPYFRVFMHRYAGIQIVHALLADSRADTFPPQRPIPVSLSAIARRFRVSRAHVRRLLAAAAREKLVRLEEDGTLVFAPEGRAALDAVFATQMIRFLSAASRTFQARPDIAAEEGVPAGRGRAIPATDVAAAGAAVD